MTLAEIRGSGQFLMDLNVDNSNPRTITETRTKKLTRSLKEFGDLGGIIYNRRTQSLVGGHQRRNILPEKSRVFLCEKFEPPTEIGTTGVGYIQIEDELYAYREVDWSRERQIAANIAANNTEVGGEFDYVTLGKAIQELKESELDETLTGYDESDINQLTLFKPDKKVEFPGKVQTPEEARKTYEAGAIKQIVMYFNQQEYAEVMEKLTRIAAAHDLKTNTDVFIYLLDQEDKKHAGSGAGKKKD